jgi:membrane-associated phospholipid phosphatase
MIPPSMSAPAHARDAAPPAAAATQDRATAGYKWALGITLALLQSAVYFGIGHAHIARSTELLRTRLDDWIPFWPWTSWCYLPFYAAVFIMCLAGFRRRSVFHGAARAVLLIMFIGATCHLFIGAEYPRPILHPPYASISAAFMASVQRIDPPGNVFPSLHVAHTTMLSLLLMRDRPRLGLVALVMATMLALSTLTTKQHFIADVLSGYVLAFIGLAFAGRAVALRGLARRG